LGAALAWMLVTRSPQARNSLASVRPEPRAVVESDDTDLELLASAEPRPDQRELGEDWSEAPAVEPESAELPLGRAADRDIDDYLSRSRLPQPESSGTVLLETRDRHAIAFDAGRFDEGDALSAMPHPHIHARVSVDDYDAINPEELGSAFLSRATETWSVPQDEDDIDGLTEAVSDEENESFSEASLLAAHTPLDSDDRPRSSPLEEDFDDASDDDERA
jgi:hypothetical protein